MAYSNLISDIQSVIKTNGNEEITGQVLQTTLVSMVNSLGGHYQYAGIATPTGSPASTESAVFYLATTAGTYTNYGGVTLTDGYLGIIKWNGTAWSIDTSQIATQIQVDEKPVQGSTNAVSSGGMYDIIGDVEGAENPITGITWVQGSINTSSGANINATTSIRSYFFSSTYPIKIDCDAESNLFIKGVYRYNSEDLSTFRDMLYYGNDGDSWDTSVTTYTITPDNKVYRVVVGYKDNSTIVATAGSDVSFNEIIGGLEKPIIQQLDTLNNYNEIEYVELIKDYPNAAYIGTNGNLTSATNYQCTNYIPVNEGDVFTYRGYCGSAGVPIMKYTAGQVKIGELLSYGDYTTNVQTVTIPAGTGYIRICGRTDYYELIVRKTIGSSQNIIEYAEEQPYNKLANKLLYIIGDSITQGTAHNATITTPYPQIVANALGMQLMNYGISASTIAATENHGGIYLSLADLEAATKESGKYYTVLTKRQEFQVYYYNGSTLSTSNIRMRTPLIQRYQYMGDNADLVIVAAGTNDFQYNWTAIGTMDSRDINTFYGAMHSLCIGLLGKYYGKPIVFMTPIKRCQTNLATNTDTDAHKGGDYGTIESENLFGLTLKDYGDIIKEVCAYYSIPVIDMYSYSMLNPQVASQLSLFDDYKTHPLQEGHNIMARYIIAQLKSIIGL